MVQGVGAQRNEQEKGRRSGGMRRTNRKVRKRGQTGGMVEARFA